MKRRVDPPSSPATPGDPLAAFKEALVGHYPSKDALLKQARAYGQRRRRRTIGSTVAAIGVLTAALWTIDPAWQTSQLATRIGERTTWTLRDGSTIQLNTHSVAVVENHLRSQRVILEQGEARFTVSHGWRKFVVQAGNATILDIGTVFNVRRLPDDPARAVDIAVLEGEVAVSTPTARQAVSLLAGRTIEVSGSGAMTERAMHPDSATWADGRLVLDGTPLRTLVAELQRYRVAPIRLRDEDVGALRLSGDFDIGRLEPLIDALPAMLPVAVTRLPDGTVTISKR
ncbi:FecR family protein [Cupriavidus pauculus]|uniref:Iron dicitrate transport regulator FecR n=1 Tax=Cupriavidus pauculus TaxID=82633 RepID=A0A2N5CC67_9BURK|nr:FecR domain-containing protein [Cupriavidus pauculus]PLP99807.1 iron dicitrate transport regulator FecR [Cupriavidus pauculus]